MPLTTDFIDLVTVFILTAVSKRDATASILEANRRQFSACKKYSETIDDEDDVGC